jgi:RNA polymerase sigma-70 factor, ECF subfamily
MPDSSSAANSMRWAGERSEDSGAGPSLEQELDSLFQAHAETLLRYTTNATADVDFARDAVQEVFLQYAEFRQSEPAPPATLVWLLRALRTVIAKNTRRQERQDLVGFARIKLTDPAPSPETEVLISEARKLIGRLAAPRELECFLLRSEGLSYQAIANIMDISIGTVGATLARAMRKLEQAIDREKGAGA